MARQINDIIAPAMEALRPVIQQVVGEMAQRLMPVFKLLAEVVEALVPAFALLMEVMRPAQELIPALANLLRGVVAVIVGLFQSFGGSLADLKDINDKLVAAMKQAVRATIVFAAQLAKFLGLDKVVESIRKTFGPTTGKGKAPAPSDAGISTMEQILREAQIAAFTAQGGRTQSTEDWLGDISGQLDAALSNQKAFNDQMESMLRRIAAALGFEALVDNVEFIATILETVETLKPKSVREAVALPNAPGRAAIAELMRRFGYGGTE
jgi:hypothetical protein